MTKDRAQKRDARTRQQETGERYVVARRNAGVKSDPAWSHCANCDGDLDVRVEGLFCTELCRETADFVRYARRKMQAGQLDDPDISYAIRIRMAMLLGGGYPGSARQLSPTIRSAVIARDQQCVQCGAPGAEIDHIADSSDDLENLQFLCKDCHRLKTEAALAPASAEQSDEAKEIWIGRVMPPDPQRLCDDPERWSEEWRPLKAQRREYLLRELHDRGVERSDFAGLSWADMWDEIDDLDAPEFGVWDDDEGPPPGTTEDELGHHYYLQELMDRDD